MKRITAVLTALALVVGLCACTEAQPTWQEQYDLGLRYLSEGNYEEAIIAFNAAIEIDPKQAPAYIGLADAYLALDDVEAAMDTLQRGLEAVGEDETISARLEELQTGLEPEPEPAPEPTTTPEPEPEPVADEDWSYDPDTWTLTISKGIEDNYFYEYPWADYSGDIRSLILQEGVTNIGVGAFTNCVNLTSVTIPDSVTSIGNHAFYGCSSLTNVTIPDGVTSIGDQAFYNCNSLTSVTIPNSVTSVGIWVLSYCNNLTDIYYTGTEEQWVANIQFDITGDESLTSAIIHYNSAG